MRLALLIHSGPEKFSPSVTRLRGPIPSVRGNQSQPSTSERIYPGQENETSQSNSSQTSQTDSSTGVYQTVGREPTHKPLLANHVHYQLSYPGRAMHALTYL